MKCDMDDKGVITISPVDSVESYALKGWEKENTSGDIKIQTETKKPFKGFCTKDSIK